MQTKEYLLLPLFEKFIQDSKSGKRLQPNGKKISKGTICMYECTYKLLVGFSKKNGSCLRIKDAYKLTHRQLVNEQNYWAKFYKKFTTFLYTTCNHYDNYAGLIIKNIKAFFNWMQRSLIVRAGDFHKQFYVRREEIPIITLLPEQLNYLIYDTEFASTLTNRMKEVKDVFVFGSTVALRFSDLMELRESNLRKINDTYYLITKSKKTSTESIIQLPDYAVDILKKYRRLNNPFLLPRFNNSNLNKYLKTLAEAAGFTQPVTKKRERQGVVKNIYANTQGQKKQALRFCNLVTTHTMRRTAITTMLSLGMPEHLVRKISGHSPASTEFYRYVALAQIYRDKETNLMFTKLKHCVLQAEAS